jgi:hypothetical protein
MEFGGDFPCAARMAWCPTNWPWRGRSGTSTSPWRARGGHPAQHAAPILLFRLLGGTPPDMAHCHAFGPLRPTPGQASSILGTARLARRGVAPTPLSLSRPPRQAFAQPRVVAPVPYCRSLPGERLPRGPVSCPRASKPLLQSCPECGAPPNARKGPAS